MINNNLKDEILSYVKKIEDPNTNIVEIDKLLTTITGLAKINSLPDLVELLDGLSKVVTGLEEGRLQSSDEHRQLFLVSAEYIKRILDNKNIESNDISIKHLLETFENIASEQPSDINKSYIYDIIRRDYTDSDNNFEKKLDKSKEVAIKLESIDKMISSINDLILNQYQLKATIEKLYDIEINDRARHRVNDINSQIKSQVLRVESSSTSLQENILSLRMLPISIIYSDITESIQQTSSQSNKKIELDFPKNDVLIDQLILQNIQNPIINIVQNSVEHGIIDSGKISISCTIIGDEVKITITDNGVGIDLEAIRLRCCKLFPHDREKILDFDEKELTPYLFMEGVTTSKTENVHGIGLANTLEDIKRVKGSIEFDMFNTNGVSVSITVPRTLTTISGYFIKSAGEKFFIPTSYITEILSINQDKVLDLVTKKAVKVRNELIAIYPLSGILNRRDANVNSNLSIIICKNNRDNIGIIVDEILYHSSAIYKKLPQNIEMIEEIQGIAFDEEFKLINILYIPKIIDQLKGIRNIELNTRYSQNDIRYKKILVVDDSAINRDIEKKMLIQNGFSVELAGDGIEALQKIKENFYHMIITDSDMPRMDGFTFIENLKKEKGYSNIPIIVLTSSKNIEDMDKYKNLGITSIYEKSDFKRDDLIKEVSEVLGENIG